MNREIARSLIEGLEKKVGVSLPNPSEFMDLLLNTRVPRFPDFYSAIADNRQRIDEDDRFHYLSIRRILRNAAVKSYRPNLPERVYNGFQDSLNEVVGYSSDAIADKARRDYTISSIMAHSTSPYSLLGKIVTKKYDDPERITMIKPVLVIPGGDVLEIANFELQHSKIDELGSLGIKKRTQLRRFR